MAIFWHKNIANKVGKFLEKSDFWQYLPNLAPSGNLVLRTNMSLSVGVAMDNTGTTCPLQ